MIAHEYLNESMSKGEDSCFISSASENLFFFIANIYEYKIRFYLIFSTNALNITSLISSLTLMPSGSP